MKIIKLLTAILALTLMLTGLAACQPASDGNTAETNETNAPAANLNSGTNVGACDMNAIAAEIDSMNVMDFEETSEISEYVKFKVKGHGEFVIRLRKDIAPITVDNFQTLVSRGFYDGLTFHRIMKGFMIQGGDPKGDGTGDAGKDIKGEFTANGFTNNLKHVRGVISMARGNEPDSASCQFFICDSATASLDGNYAAFGYVMAGMETVDSIASVEVQSNGREMSDPIKDVIIEKIVFVKDNHNH